jgi:malate dehydrogenase (quinone)
MLDLFQKCFPQQMPEWEPKLRDMIPSYGKKLAEHPDLFQSIHASTSDTLGLSDYPATELDMDTKVFKKV